MSGIPGLIQEYLELYRKASYNWPTFDVPRGGVKIYAPGEVVPSIKYGEHRWGYFA